ncbi:hypothetical protein [Burkholderia sp. BCC0322]|uniref:hypothetical protein n=1 Tax=unclassified Burkholderia TaxID=2613784 RepID=UPI00158E3791|nr:hypothetical protein [Burkholderia sp. BCC0322]
MLIAAWRVAAPGVSFHMNVNCIHKHLKFIRNSNHVDWESKPNQEIADLKIAMTTSMDSGGDRLSNQRGKTGTVNRGNMMRARHVCRNGQSGGARRVDAMRPGRSVYRMETVLFSAGKSCAATVAMPVPISESFDLT